ncbi:MAG: GNAT family N-acetyltransferase [Bacilli bacterium]|nr:GNAT family N-acetyltransferase [Bacilli bacterium]
MQIYNIDLLGKNILDFASIVDTCKEIINENLQINGGTLKISDIFERDYNWTNLIIATIDNQIVGFALIRTSNNMHNLTDVDFYYYLSDIVVKKNLKKQGIGKALMTEAVACRDDAPLVASILNNNLAAMGLLSKFMTCYGFSKKGKYARFIDNRHYAKLYGDIDSELSESMHSKRAK